MTTKRDDNGKLRDELGQFANDQAEPGTVLAVRSAPNRGAYAIEIGIEQARSIVNRAYSGNPTFQSSAPAISMLTCIAATSPHIAAADDKFRDLVLVGIRERMDMTGFEKATAAPGFTADTAVNSLIALLPRVPAGSDSTATSGEDYEAAVRSALPTLNNRYVALAVSDFTGRNESRRRANLGVFAMMGEREAWLNSQTDRIEAPPEYPFKSVPPTATIAAIDAMLMHEFENTEPKEIASTLSYLGWGRTYIEAAVRDRIGQLRPDLTF
jgi:hypothetical protein